MMPSAVESIITLLEQHAMMSREDYKAAREGKDFCGGAVELEQMVIEGGLAMIPIKGPLGMGLDAFEKGAGATDYADIMEDIHAADENPNVENIIGIFDTPGGSWGGLLETANAIRDSKKPFYGFIPPGGTMASAGMFLGAVCSGRFLCPSAQAGSIGVYCAYMDMTEMAAKRGVKVKVFSSGKFKGMGVPGTALTSDQEGHLQEQVTQLAGEFYQHMRKHLGEISDEDMQGQMFRAERAVELGFADGIVSSLEELKGFLR